MQGTRIGVKTILLEAMHCAQSSLSKAELEHAAKAYGIEGLFHFAYSQHPSCPTMAETRCLHTKGVQETDW